MQKQNKNKKTTEEQQTLTHNIYYLLPDNPLNRLLE